MLGVKFYRNNESKMPIKYPGKLDQLKSNTLNSNSWDSSNLKYSGAKNYINDFSGLDPARSHLIDKKYFTK